jgi:hypothetical protein
MSRPSITSFALLVLHNFVLLLVWVLPGSMVATAAVASDNSVHPFVCPDRTDGIYANRIRMDRLNDATCGSTASTVDYTNFLMDALPPKCVQYCASCIPGVCSTNGMGTATCSDPTQCTLCRSSGCPDPAALHGPIRWLWWWWLLALLLIVLVSTYLMYRRCRKVHKKWTADDDDDDDEEKEKDDAEAEAFAAVPVKETSAIPATAAAGTTASAPAPSAVTASHAEDAAEEEEEEEEEEDGDDDDVDQFSC